MRDLSAHILDIARNSVEAGATAIDLMISEDPDTDTLSFSVADDGRGMDAELVRKAQDPFYTSRTTRKVGLGIPLLKATCDRCGGSLTIESKPGQGTVVRATMQLSNVDRPPMGDIGAVVQSLACEAPRAVTHYRHEIDGRSYELDTEELGRELGDVAVTEPTVLRWIREHVNQQTRLLGSKA